MAGGVERFDLIVVGGGIVGLATAFTFMQRRPGATVAVLEKEAELATHQTGRNSGVIHSGIYYKPGSMKATTCRRGVSLLLEFCRERGVAFEQCGKVIVATDDAEASRLAGLVERGQANGVTCERITAEQVREIEPHVSAVAGIRVEDTGIVDYVGICRVMAEAIDEEGGRVVTGARVVRIERTVVGVRVHTAGGEVYEAGSLVNCAGLHADRVTRRAGDTPPARIVPFRGEYYELRPQARGLVKHLIYPVPDPAFPFLGVHFTRMIDRDEHGCLVECGPNAVLAFAREGYTRTTLRLGDLAGTLTYPAFWRLALRHWRAGLGEMHRSWSKRAFVRALQRLIPEITGDDLEPAPAGVRAQALAPDGRLLDDFAVVARDRMVHVVNAPSPAATASLAIGERICEMISDHAGAPAAAT